MASTSRGGRVAITTQGAVGPSSSSQPHSQSQKSASSPAQPLNSQDPKEIQAQYARTGIKPPPKQDNRRRFKTFIDRINRRQWAYLSDGVNSKLTYNRRPVTLYELIQLLKDEFAPRINSTIEIVTVIGGRKPDDANSSTTTASSASTTATPNPDDGPVAARIRVKTISTGAAYAASATHRCTEYARHMFVEFTDRKISAIYDLSDLEAKHRDEPLPAGHIVPLPGLRPPPPRVSIDMLEFYSSYLACLNTTPLENLNEELASRFVKPGGLVWNGAKMTAEQYGRMMSDARESVEGLEFVAHLVLVDETRQLIAVRLEYTGVPVRPFGGAGPNGRTVFFGEHAFYWLEQGKISDVLTVVDWEAFRSNLIH